MLPLVAASYQKNEPEPAAPAPEATEAVGTPTPHCELDVAIGEDGKAFTSTDAVSDITGQTPAITSHV